MAKGKWDAIVIGGSFSGLSIGALLAQAGKKVLILEKEGHHTGRMGSPEHNGQIIDNGVHGIMTMGTSEEIFNRLGLSYPEVIFWKTTKLLFEGEWLTFADFLSRGDAAKIFQDEVLPLSKEEMERHEDIEMLDWLKTKTDNKYTHYLFDFAAWGGLVGGIGDSAAGESLLYLKQIVSGAWSDTAQAGGGISVPFSAGMPQGGFGAVNKLLIDKCEELGVEIRTNVKVVDVVIEAGEVKGVEVLTGKRVIPSHFQDAEFIKAPLVVSSVPIWSLFSVVSEDRFPQWYVEWVKYIASRYVNIGNIYYGMDRVPVGDDFTIWYVDKLPRTGQRGGLMWFPAYCGNTGQHQAAFWFQANWCDGPSGIDPLTLDRSAKNRRDMKEFFDLFEEDVKEVWPGFEEGCLWKLRQVARCQTSAVPSNTQRYRPGVQPPGVKGFYITSDTLRDTMPMGTAAAGCCAIKCIDTILEKE